MHTNLDKPCHMSPSKGLLESLEQILETYGDFFAQGCSAEASHLWEHVGAEPILHIPFLPGCSDPICLR